MPEVKDSEVVLKVEHLKKYFPMGKHAVLKAVDDVSFEMKRGETLGIVGESGCGKTTCGRTVIGLYDKTDGTVLYKGKDVHAMKGNERKAFTKEVQMIFQDPYASLDPRLKVNQIVGEGMRIHKMYSSNAEIQDRVFELLDQVYQSWFWGYIDLIQQSAAGIPRNPVSQTLIQKLTDDLHCPCPYLFDRMGAAAGTNCRLLTADKTFSRRKAKVTSGNFGNIRRHNINIKQPSQL